MAKNIKQKQTKTIEKKTAVVVKESNTSLRGRIIEGTVLKKFPHRVVIETERTVYLKKYERFFKRQTKHHARVPSNIDVQVGDYVRIRECRPLSKIINFIVIEKIRSAVNGGQK